jgi:hypothetical protein
LFSTDASGTYQIKAKPYISRLLYQGILNGSLEAAGSIYYHTPVYSTDEKPKIVVVERVTGTGKFYMDYHRDSCGQPYDEQPTDSMFKVPKFQIFSGNLIIF